MNHGCNPFVLSALFFMIIPTHSKAAMDSPNTSFSCPETIQYIADLPGTATAPEDEPINNPYMCLYKAILNRDLNVISYLVKHNVNIDAYCFFPLRRALTIAIDQGALTTVSRLLELGSDPNYIHHSEHDHEITPPLNLAVRRGLSEIVTVLLDHGANVDTGNITNITPLHEAAKIGNLPLAKLLVERNANVNAQDNEGETPLDYATHGEHHPVIEFLKESGAVYTVEITTNKQQARYEKNRCCDLCIIL